MFFRTAKTCHPTALKKTKLWYGTLTCSTIRFWTFCKRSWFGKFPRFPESELALACLKCTNIGWCDRQFLCSSKTCPGRLKFPMKQSSFPCWVKGGSFRKMFFPHLLFETMLVWKLRLRYSDEGLNGGCSEIDFTDERLEILRKPNRKLLAILACMLRKNRFTTWRELS